jgi:hypothetical protein
MVPLFDYFMVRVTRTGNDAVLAGLIERLGTGEKRTFGSEQQLLDLLASWSDPGLKVQAQTGSSNAAEAHPEVPPDSSSEQNAVNATLNP